MNERFVLPLFGVFLGSLGALGMYLLLPLFHSPLPAGSQFESLKEFQRTWLIRDERDAGDDLEVIKQERVLRGVLDPNQSLKHRARSGRKKGFSLHLTINPRPAWREAFTRLWVMKKVKSLHHIRLRNSFLGTIARRDISAKELSLLFDPHPNPIMHQILGGRIASDLVPTLVSRFVSTLGERT